MTPKDVKIALNHVQAMENQMTIDVMQAYALEAAGDSIQVSPNTYLEAWHKANVLIMLVSDPKKQQMLVLRYLHYKQWDEIARTMSRSLQHVDRMHRAALQEIADKIQRDSI